MNSKQPFNYGLISNIKIGKDQLDYNLLAITQLNEYVKVSKDLVTLNIINISKYQSIKAKTSILLNTLYKERSELIARRHNHNFIMELAKRKSANIPNKINTRLLDGIINNLNNDDKQLFEVYYSKLIK